MFRANTNHQQQSLFESTQWMNPKIRNRLDQSWAPIFYEHVFCQIDEAPFAVLYGTTGNPNFPVNILLSLEYIKHMKDCNDLELLNDFYFDYLVNYAVGIRTLGELNLAERTLYYFRERIYTYCLENPGKDELLFNQFIKLLKNFAEKAEITLNEQRTDTTLFMSNIKKAGRISLAYDILIKTIKAIPEDKRTDALKDALEPNFKTDVLYHTKMQEGDSKLTIIFNLCKDALTILTSLPNSCETEAVRLTSRFLNEQTTTEVETGKLKPKTNKEITSDSLQSAYDEEATFRRKGNVSQSGYVLELSETCSKDNPFQLITDYAVEPNNKSDTEIFSGRIESIRENTGCTDMYGDGGFHSEAVHQTASENRMKIHLTNMSGTEPCKKLPITEYEIDETTNIIQRCPSGHTPLRTAVSNGQTTARFPHETCESCVLRERCHSKKQVKDRIVRISLKAVTVSREREAMKMNRLENTSKRAGIEGSNSALKRKGLAKLKVRGRAKSTVICALKVTAQNLKRFIKYMQGGYTPKVDKCLPNGMLAPNYS
jgi:hypothetical protein